MATDPRRNPTTIFLPGPGGGFVNQANPGYPLPLADQDGYSVPSWYDSVDENGNPVATGKQQTGTATAGQWTGANGLVTQGVMNPYALANPQNPYGSSVSAAPKGQAPSPGAATRPAPPPGADIKSAYISTPNGIQRNPYFEDWATSDVAQTPAQNLATPAALTTTKAAATPGSYQQGVTTSYEDPAGGRSTVPNNQYQFATPQTAAALAKRLGGTVVGDSLGGPSSTSSPQLMIQLPGGKQPLNAGLLQGIIDRYGDAPGSYGASLIEGAKAQAMGQSYIDPFANKGGSNVANRGAAPTTQKPITLPGFGGGPAGGAAPTAGGGAPANAGKALSFEEWQKQNPSKPTPGTSPSGGSIRQASAPAAPAPAPTTGAGEGRISLKPSTNSPFTLDQFGYGSDASIADGTQPDGTEIYGEYGYDAGAVPSGESIGPTDYGVLPGSPNWTPPAEIPIDSNARREAQYQAAGYYKNSQGGWSAPGTPDPGQEAAYQEYLNSFNTGSGGGTQGGSQGGGGTAPGGGAPSGGGPPLTGSGTGAGNVAPNYTPGYPGVYGSKGTYNGIPFNPTYTAENGESLQYKSEADRAAAMGRGESIDEGLIDYINRQQEAALGYETAGNAAYSGIAAGQGGYTPEQQAAIMREQELRGATTSDEALQSNYLRPDEEAGIQGDPWAPYRQLGLDEQSIDQAGQSRDANVRGALTSQDASVRGALAGGASALRGATASQATNMRGAFGDTAENLRSAYGQGANDIRGSLDYGEQNVRAAIDPTKLNVSDEYLANYNFTPENEQDMVSKAARGVGVNATANEDLLLRQAAASGNTSPLALTAARERLAQTSAVNQADAMTDARIAARRLGLDTTQQRETTRLGAAQNLAGLQSSSELSLGSRRTAAEEGLAGQQAENERYLGTTGIGVEGTIGAAERGTEQYLSAQQQQAEQFLGGSRTGAEKELGESNIGTEKFKTGTNLAAGQAADTAQSQRAAQVATNRQTTGQANQNTKYGQGMAAYGALSGNSKAIADQQLAQQQEFRNYLASQGTQRQQNVSVGQQQRIGNAGTQAGAVNAATGNAINNSKTPGMASQLAGLVGGLVLGHAKGGKIAGPTPALVGEAGPELILDIPSYGVGGVIDDGIDPYTSGSGETAYEGGGLPGDDIGDRQMGDDPRKKSPLYKQILAQMAQQRFGGPVAGSAPNTGPNGGYVLPAGSSGGINPLSFFGLAKGGVVKNPHHPYGNRGRAELVTRPQIRMLGAHGKQAVVPLIKRPGNHLDVSDIPRLMRGGSLAAKYAAHGA